MKTKISIFFFIFSLVNLIFFKVDAQTSIPNSGFESWTDSINAMSWKSFNVNGPNPSLSFHSIKKTTDSYSGSYAIKLESKTVPVIGNLPGLAALGFNDQTYKFEGGIPFSICPKSLKGYYKYTCIGNDSMLIFILLTKTTNGIKDTIGFGSFTNKNNVNAYTQFIVPIAYNTLLTSNPDTMNIVLLSSIGTVGNGTLLFIDDLSIDGSPYINTGTSTIISPNTMLCYGDVIGTGCFPIISRGICYDTVINPDTLKSKIIVSGTLGSYSALLNNLDYGKTYHYKAFATNSSGIAYGKDSTFTTQSISPIVSTGLTTNISQTSAVSSGVVISDGGSPILISGICYDSIIAPDTSKSKSLVLGAIGSFSCNLTGLIPNKIYHVRAFSKNSVGVSYGADSAFTTLKINPQFAANQILFLSPPFVVQFTNSTANASDYDFTWNFGDGTTLASNNPSIFHQYSFNGLYSVTLIARHKINLSTDTLLKTDYIYCTGGTNDLNEQSKYNIKSIIYPNPVSNELIIEIKGNNEKLNLEILNSIGQIVFKGNLIEKTIIETTNFSPGIYVIKLENGKTYQFKKIVKE
ncbi:MAG: T9SS type A sorting domain-containing protein [Bacteroidia bacterium]